MEGKELEKVRRANVRNLLAKVRDGKPLSKEQLELVRHELNEKDDVAAVKPVTLSAQEFANLVNLDKRRVQQLAKEGVIEKEGRGLYPLGQITAYIRYLQDLVQQRKVQPEVVEGMLNPEQEKARADKERADKLALDNKVTRGELVHADEVEKEWVQVLMAVRAGFLALPSNVSEEVSMLKSARQVKKRLTDEVSEILENLSNAPDREDD